MKINENLTIAGSSCLLVPYRREHVETYHTWMQDTMLQQTTESEPLSIEEEYAMQLSWRDDEDKLTFIVLDTTPAAVAASAEGAATTTASLPLQQRTRLMAGDINLFWNDPEDRSVAEIDVMVAEEGSRRKGIAREAVQLMMAFAVARLAVTRFRAKILEDNAPSLALFHQLGYQETRRVQVFHEVHMELDVSSGTPAHQHLTSQALIMGTYE